MSLSYTGRRYTEYIVHFFSMIIPLMCFAISIPDLRYPLLTHHSLSTGTTKSQCSGSPLVTAT